MTERSPNLGWAQCAAVCAVLSPLLADCGPARNQFAPPCPGQAILGDAADYDIHRASGAPGAPGAPGGGRDLTDLIMQARIVGIQGSCRPADEKNQIAVTVSVAVEVNRGPAMPGREAQVPVFIAVTDGETVLDKHVYLLQTVFPSNVDRVPLTTGEVYFRVPVTSTKSAAAYTVLAGFQLTPDQMGQGRRNGGP